MSTSFLRSYEEALNEKLRLIKRKQKLEHKATNGDIFFRTKLGKEITKINTDLNFLSDYLVHLRNA